MVDTGTSISGVYFVNLSFHSSIADSLTVRADCLILGVPEELKYNDLTCLKHEQILHVTKQYKVKYC